MQAVCAAMVLPKKTRRTGAHYCGSDTKSATLADPAWLITTCQFATMLESDDEILFARPVRPLTQEGCGLWPPGWRFRFVYFTRGPHAPVPLSDASGCSGAESTSFASAR